MKIEELKDKTIAILGLGVEGLTTAEYLLAHQISFTVIDEKTEEELSLMGEEYRRVIDLLHRNAIVLILGKPFDAETLNAFDIVIRSPGIPLQKGFLRQYKGGITSQTKLFFDNCPSHMIGVTGTKGKGTTSTLIYEMLKKGGFDAYLGGNIGKPPFTFLDSLTSTSFVVLEMSSFQLQDLEKSPSIAVMLMVTSEHLDHHLSTEEYREAKRNILKWQNADDMAILNTDYPATNESASKTPAKVAWVSRYQEVESGCFVRDNRVILRLNGQETEVIGTSDVLLPGAHNLENVCAATMAAFTAGVSIADIAFVLRTFKGLEHRLELVRVVHGVRYYDDSFSTVPETAIAAISSFKEPEILILGGSSKNSDFSELGKIISSVPNIKAIIGIGVEWERIKAQFPSSNFRFQIIEGLIDMESIVRKASELAEPRDVVLLSPACASFDMFRNYKDRGNQFKEQVDLL